MCQNDTDCPLGLVCYDGTERWITKDSKYVEVYGEDEPFCECSGFFGWTGDECDEVGFGWISVGISFVSVGILCITLFVSMSELFFRIQCRTTTTTTTTTRHTNGKRPKRCEVNAAFTSIVLLFTTALLGIAHTATRLCTLLNPRDNDRAPPPGVEEGQKFGACDIEERALLPVALVLGLTSALNVSLIWLEVADNANNLRGKQGGNLETYRKPVIVAQTSLLVFVLVSLAAGQQAVSAAIVLPFLIALIISFLLGSHRLTKLLQSSSIGNTGNTGNTDNTRKRGTITQPGSSLQRNSVTGNTEGSSPGVGNGVGNGNDNNSGNSKGRNKEKDNDARTARTVRLIRQTAIAVAINMVLVLIGVCIYIVIVVSGWKSWSPPRKPPVVSIGISIAFLFFHTMLAALARYLWKTGRSRRRALALADRGNESGVKGGSTSGYVGAQNTKDTVKVTNKADALPLPDSP